MRTQGLQRLSALLLAFSGATSVFGAQVQKSGLVLPPDAPKYLNKVRDMFTETYSAYTYVAQFYHSARPILSYAESMLGDTMTWLPSVKDLSTAGTNGVQLLSTH